MDADREIERQVTARREQIAAWCADRRNRDLIELGGRVQTDLVAENATYASVEWRAGIVASRAWNAQHRPR